MTTKLLRRRPRRGTALAGLVLGMSLCLGTLAPATTAAASTSAPTISSFNPTSGEPEPWS